MGHIRTNKSLLVWSDDERLVTKRLTHPWTSEVLGAADATFRNELRVNRMLLHRRPPVPTPRLVGWHRRQRQLTFEAVAGAPLGSKFPLELTATDIDDAIDLTARLGAYRPSRGWHVALPVHRRLRMHLRDGLVTAEDADLIASTAQRSRSRWHFAHADVTARNLLRSAHDGRLWLIDWEWAGVHPPLYDMAFLWFSLIDIDGGRAQVEGAIEGSRRVDFLTSAALVQLLHLQMWRGMADRVKFAAKHALALTGTLAELRG